MRYGCIIVALHLRQLLHRLQPKGLLQADDGQVQQQQQQQQQQQLEQGVQAVIAALQKWLQGTGLVDQVPQGTAMTLQVCSRVRWKGSLHLHCS